MVLFDDTVRHGQAPLLWNRMPKWGLNLPTYAHLRASVLSLALMIAYLRSCVASITARACGRSRHSGRKQPANWPCRSPVPLMQTMCFLLLCYPQILGRVGTLLAPGWNRLCALFSSGVLPSPIPVIVLEVLVLLCSELVVPSYILGERCLTLPAIVRFRGIRLLRMSCTVLFAWARFVR